MRRLTGSEHAVPPLKGPAEATGVDAAWIDVVRTMDETYGKLVACQVELERKNASLEEMHAFIASVMASMTDLLVVTDLEGRIQQVNAALERAFGRAAADLLGQAVETLLVPKSRPLLRTGMELVRRRQRAEDLELAFQCGATRFPVSANLTARIDPRGRAIGAVLLGRPTGELRRAYRDLAATHDRLKSAQQQLVHAEKMASLGRLVAGVAHELNNPISFVYGNAHVLNRYGLRLRAYLDALHEGAAPERLAALRTELRVDRALADLKGATESTLAGAERVRDIVESLRRFASEGQGAHEPFDLVAVVRTAVTWVVKGQRPDLAVEADLPERLVVEGHAGHVQQVVMNLVQNAVDAMADAPDERARLRLRLSADAGEAVLTVRDHGPGIAAGNVSQVFEPFFTTKPPGKGTGLGLAISYGIVTEHGGRLEADNHPEGGAVFTMRLPLPPGSGPAGPGAGRGGEADHG